MHSLCLIHGLAVTLHTDVILSFSVSIAATRQDVLLWVSASDAPSSMPSTLWGLRERPLEGLVVKTPSRAIILGMLGLQRKENSTEIGLGKKNAKKKKYWLM